MGNSHYFGFLYVCCRIVFDFTFLAWFMDKFNS